MSIHTQLLVALSKADKDIWIILAASVGVSLISTPIAIAYIVSQSSSIDIVSKGTEINLRSDELNQSAGELLIRLDELERANRELVQAARAGKPIKGKLAQVENAIEDSTAIAEDLGEQQAQLDLLVE